MTNKDIIVVGSSAGGVNALCQLCSTLPADLPAAIFITQHLSPSAKSVLPQLLERSGPLPAVNPVDGQSFERGHIYVAPPDHHLLVRQDRVLVRRGPYENRTRPAINPLFRSAAMAYGGRVIGVVLTGLLDDGTEGLIAIKAAGGTSVVQDPEEAAWPSMPRNALQRDHVDAVVSLAQMGDLLKDFASETAGPSIPLPEDYATEDLIAAQEFALMETNIETPGVASQFSCPDCGGVLNSIAAGDELRFRCQVGHAFTPLGLAEAQNGELERALGIAIRTHKDRIKLFGQMAQSARARRLPYATSRWEAAADEAEHLIDVLERAAAALRKPVVDDVA